MNLEELLQLKALLKQYLNDEKRMVIIGAIEIILKDVEKQIENY